MEIDMKKSKKINYRIIIVALLLLVLITVPINVSGEVKPISDMEEKMEGISEEEKKVLETLFTLSQEMSEMEQEETELSVEIETLQQKITDLEEEIEEMQGDYDRQLSVLEKVLVNYQRGGPASYLEILLSADNLTSFLKSINLIKDISHNTEELLISLEKSKKALQEEKERLDDQFQLLAKKQSELKEHIKKTEALKQEQETYLASLQEKQSYYRERLDNLVTMWEDCTIIFDEISKEITRVIGEGYFTLADLNLTLGFPSMQGAINGDSFNTIIKENTTLPETIFYFGKDQVVIEVPKKHLVLNGKFVKASESSILYEVKEGTFYDLPLEQASIDELFKERPLLIDFKKISGDLVMIDFTLNWIRNEEGQLAFEINPKW